MRLWDTDQEKLTMMTSEEPSPLRRRAAFSSALVVIVVSVLSGMGVTASAKGAVTIGAEPTAAAGLPDGRRYELVSPGGAGAKNGYGLLGDEPGGRRTSVAVDGESVVYSSEGAFPGSPSNGLINWYVATRAGSGWATSFLNLPTPEPQPFFGIGQPEWFPPDRLTHPVVTTTASLPLEEPLTEHIPSGVNNLFVNNADGRFSLVTTNPPRQLEGQSTALMEVLGTSSDVSHVIFHTATDLTPNAPEGVTIPNNLLPILYEWAGGELTLVGILPDGSVLQANTDAARWGNAISTDGSRIFFTTAPQATQLYLREDGTHTIDVSTSQRMPLDQNGPGTNEFEGATPSGAAVFLLSSVELTDEAQTGGGDLYRYCVEAGTACPTAGRLVDLTVDHNPADTLAGGRVQGVLGSSGDGSRVYFVADGQLVPGSGTNGQPNLYLWEGGALTFIATLNASDSDDWLSFFNRGEQSAYVTPDGGHVAFLSSNKLTGFDNVNPTTGTAEPEVYEYSAPTAEHPGGTLVCASCNPSGAAPTGPAVIPIPGNKGRVARVMSDDGTRLFFSSKDALVPGSGNGHFKVYEYENGVIHMLSSGAGQGDDFFVGSDATGDNAFFMTSSQLVSQDEDQLVDLYDARVGGGFPSGREMAPCAGDGCQGAAAPLPAAITPASATFSGAGNVAPTLTSKPPPRVNPKLSQQLKRCRRYRDRRKRARCEGQARKRYAAAARKPTRKGHV